jgi:hypothetical protein
MIASPTHGQREGSPRDSPTPLGMTEKSIRNAGSTLKLRILVFNGGNMSKEEFQKKELETLWAPWRVEYFEKEPRDGDFS